MEISYDEKITGFLYFHSNVTDVCIDVKITTKELASEISWSLGSCNSNGQQYENNQEYIQTCCFNTSPSRWLYNFRCMDSHGDGWHGAFITINERRYCEDFYGSEEIAIIEANPSKNILFVLDTHVICLNILSKTYFM